VITGEKSDENKTEMKNNVQEEKWLQNCVNNKGGKEMADCIEVVEETK
jgi:hypothetical protein